MTPLKSPPSKARQAAATSVPLRRSAPALSGPRLRRATLAPQPSQPARARAPQLALTLPAAPWIAAPRLAPRALTPWARRVWRALWRRRLARLGAALAGGVRGVFYRVSMPLIAAGLVWLIWQAQNIAGFAGDAGFHGAWWQTGLRGLELLWLTPAPLALALWAGWLIWAEAARRDPKPRPAPLMAVRVDGPATMRMPARIVFRFVTRGEQVETLRASVEAARAAMRATPAPEGAWRNARDEQGAPYRIEIVSETPLSSLAAPDCAVYAPPDSYTTPAGSRFKARALSYLQQVSPPRGDEWRLYLDEESRVDATLIAGLYDFIASAEKAADASPEAPRRIGQGAILYQGGSAFFRAADGLRTGDDLGRFRLQYGLGAPLFGAHGSFLLVRAMDETALSFDVGSANSITEDAAWALRAWARGWRFGWVRGYLREQPPQRVMDFVRQRARWLTGVRLVAIDRSTPLRYRLMLLFFTALWQLSCVPLLVTIAALATHTPPIPWMRLPADMTWATFMLAYLQGMDTQAARDAREHDWPGPAWLRPLWSLWARMREWPLALGIFWYSLLEIFAVVYSLRRDRGFFVIHKPQLTPAQEIRPLAADTPATTAQGVRAHA